MADFNHLREWLQPKLDARHISPEQLAHAAGITRAAVYFIMADTNRPTTQTMAKVCAALGEPLEDALKQYTPRKIGRPAGSKTVYRRGRF